MFRHWPYAVVIVVLVGLVGTGLYAQNNGGYYGIVSGFSGNMNGNSLSDSTDDSIAVTSSITMGENVLSIRSNDVPQIDVGTVAASVLSVNSGLTPQVKLATASTTFGVTGASYFRFPSDGRFLLSNNAGTASILLDFGTSGKILAMEPNRGASNGSHAGAEQTLTFAGGGGDASKTATNLCPANVWVMGISARWTTTATTCTSADVGDGSDVDMFADNTAVTSGSTFSASAATATTRMFTYNPTAFSVVVTGVGGNCVSGVVRVTCHYQDYAAAIAN